MTDFKEKVFKEVSFDSLKQEVEKCGDDINAVLLNLLLKEKLKITFAESCTGGLLAKKMTELSGASECFDGSYVTYSNEQKMRLLGVKEETLKNFGAVSYQTALEMSRGVYHEFKSDIGVGVTGIAGPGGGTPEKPVGLVYISVCTKDAHIFCKLNLDGDRSRVRNVAYKMAYALAIQAVENRLVFV